MQLIHFVFFLLMAPVTAMADTAAEAPSWFLEVIGYLVSLSDKFPIISSLLMVVGVLRVTFKPLFSLARLIVGATESKTDDGYLDQVEASRLYKSIAYVLDWFASVKLPKKP